MGLLLLAIAPLPYSYYIFLRWAILLSCCLHGYYALQKKRMSALVIFIVLGVLFNPFDPVYLSKGLWMFIDLLAALSVFIGMEDIKKGKPF